ncbi:unnamed protein product [Adineta ricciae]|uniref:G-protein coupled receptors family 1 profile domain-containing protein n=1 Tax=Adineta ricciae TaxID=249248 RepID=A0A814R832_ADIRI|nr:unnamed protein product [Adineta ricciae]CAF1452819.1 unnamed protein product [Adineta ricciae]
MNTTLSPSVSNDLQAEVNKASVYIYPITISLTIISNLVNIYVLYRPKLRSCSITHYFLAFAFTCLLYTCEVPVMMFLRLRFGYVVTSTPIGCRLQTFVIYVLPLFISIMLVFASADRFFASALSARIRNLSRVRIAQQIIIIIALLTAIYAFPHALLYDLNPKTNQCVAYSYTIANIYLSSRIVLSYILIPIAMIVFDCLLVRNIQRQTHRTVPSAMNAQREIRMRRVENQLVRMIVLQVSAYLVFSIPAGVGYTIITFVPSMNTPFMAQVRVILSLWQQTIYFLPLLLYIFSSKTYRQEFLKTFSLNNLQ